MLTISKHFLPYLHWSLYPGNDGSCCLTACCRTTGTRRRPSTHAEVLSWLPGNFHLSHTFSFIYILHFSRSLSLSFQRTYRTDCFRLSSYEAHAHHCHRLRNPRLLMSLGMYMVFKYTRTNIPSPPPQPPPQKEQTSGQRLGTTLSSCRPMAGPDQRCTSGHTV